MATTFGTQVKIIFKFFLHGQTNPFLTALPPALWKKPEGFQQNLVLDAMRAAQFASMYTISIMQGAVFPLPPRIRVQLLGGKYQPIFDYKCEIVSDNTPG